MTRVSRIALFSLTTADAPALAAFYREAFGCVQLSADRQSGVAFEELMGVRGSADRILLALGREVIELLQFDQPGAPYPAGATASDLCFQHFAVVVPDMARAWQRLGAVKGWRAITTGDPQKLPASSGGVTAFKFRDPEGHPLEFLMFPRGQGPEKWQIAAASVACQGLDHTAISILNSEASLRFYSALGFRRTTCTQNEGKAQDALDGLDLTHVEVTALELTDPTPHLELLAYRRDPTERLHKKQVEPNDVACTRLIFKSGQTRPKSLIDPDGHRMIIMPDLEDCNYSQ
jgi:catechol 2,3-dioxygenase-like lactoylglutathione lyase family enzyme